MSKGRLNMSHNGEDCGQAGAINCRDELRASTAGVRRRAIRLGTYLATLLLFVPSLGWSASSVDYSTPEGREAIRSIIHANVSQATYCFAEAQETDPALKGKLVFSFSINANGRASNPAPIEATGIPADHALAKCIAHLLETLEFPTAVRDQTVTVERFPFSFGM